MSNKSDLTNEKLDLARKDILDVMETLRKSPAIIDVVWMDEDSAMHETAFERLWNIFLTLQGDENKLFERFPDLKSKAPDSGE